MNKFENPQYYDGRFTDNILVVGQTGCGKTTFVQNLEKKQNVWRLRVCWLGLKNNT